MSQTIRPILLLPKKTGIWPMTAVVSGQTRLGGTKIRIILNIALILHYDSFVYDRDLNFLVNP